MHILITETNGECRRIHFNVVPETVTFLKPTGSFVVDLPLGFSTKDAISLIEDAPKYFCVNFEVPLKKEDGLVFCIPYSKVSFEKAAQMMQAAIEKKLEQIAEPFRGMP